MKSESPRIWLRLKGIVCPNAVFIALWTLLFGLFLAGMPKYYDDLYFMEFLKPWFDKQCIVNPEGGGNIITAGFPLQELIETWRTHFTDDNIRIGNLLAPVLLLFPKWVGSGLMTVLLTWTVILGLRLVHISVRRSALVPVALFLWTFMLPWWDHIGSLVFQLNYILAPWLVLLTLWLAIRGSVRGLWRLFGLFVLAVIAGMSQEGVVFPVLVSYAVVVLLFRRLRTAANLTVLCGFAAGLALLFLSPGMQVRLTYTLSAGNADYASLYRSVLFYNGMAPVLFLSMLAVRVTRSGWRRSFTDPCVVFVLTCIVVSLVMIFNLKQPGRSLWSMDVASIIGILCLLRQMFGTSDYTSVSARWISALLVAVTFTYLAVVDTEAFRCRRAMAKVMESYAADSGRYVFADISVLGHRPLLSGYMPDRYFHMAAGMYLGLYYERILTGEMQVRLIPGELRHVTSLSGNPLRDNPGIRDVDGLIVATSDAVSGLNAGKLAGECTLSGDFGNGYVPFTAICTSFRSEADGREYVWIYPMLDWYVMNFKQLHGLRKQHANE